MKSLCMSSLMLVLLLSVPFAMAEDEEINPYASIKTKVFGRHDYHEVPQLVTNSKAGLGVGYAVFGCAMLFSFVFIIWDEIERNKDIN